MRLGVTIPLANEEQTVDELLGRVLAQLGPDDCIFCVLDRASGDGTRKHVEIKATQDPRVVLVWAPTNRCVVDAYFCGYRQALSAGCRWILEMDGGLSHSPEQIGQFVQAMQQGYDYAGGCRFTKGGSYSGRVSRFLLSWGGTKLANLLLGTRMKDMTSGFECFTRPALETVVAQGVCSRGHFFQTEIRLQMHDWNWTEVPIHYRGPSKSVAMGTIREAIRNLWGLRREARSRRARSLPTPRILETMSLPAGTP
jgi:dolichol-phosphate mannosyltransferase